MTDTREQSRTLPDLAKAMREIDYTMLSTIADNGALAGRPMSNNRDVDYDGDSYYFTHEDANMVGEIEANPNVSLAFQHRSLFVAVEGRADLIRDKGPIREHWSKDGDRYFPDGPDSEGVVMIHVHADRVHYWDGEDDGEVKL